MRNTYRKRDTDRGRGRSRLPMGSLMWDLIPGLQDHVLRPKADAQLLSHAGVPNEKNFKRQAGS